MAKVYLYSSSLSIIAIDGMSHMIDDSYLTEVPNELIERYELVKELFHNVQNELEFYREETSQEEEDDEPLS